MNQKVEKAKDALIALLAVGLGVCIALTAWAVFLRQPQAAALVPDVPESAPEQLEPNQTPMQGEDGTGTKENATDKDGGFLVGLSYNEEVIISIRSQKASLYYGNRGGSKQDAIVRLVVQEQVLAQSGRLTPGNEVQTLDLVEGAVSRLSKGSYEGEIQVFYYDPDTGERSMLNTVIPVTVQVVG